jgi:glucosylceramidase
MLSHLPLLRRNCRRPAARRALAWVFIILGGWASAGGQEVKLYVTSRAGDRIAPKPPLRFGAPGKTGGPRFQINDAVRYQRIDGFGASLLEAGLICLHSLAPAQQEGVLRALFDPQTGAGFSAMKTVIAATDFMSAGPYYTYDDTPGDIQLKNFSIQRDLGPNGLVAYIKRARRYGSFVLQAPMDYPPDWMLFDVHANQDVDPAYFDALARYYLRYLQEYAKQGIVIDYLSPFNEPGIYTKIPYTKIRDLVKDHLGPLLEKSRVRTKIQVCDSCNREDAYQNLPIILEDSDARKYVAGLSYHGYQFKDYDKIAELHGKYPELPLWMTEVDHSYNTDTPRSKPLPRYDYEDGDFWGNQIASDMESGAAAWIYWNMILDERGGPYLLSEVHRDSADNYQHPVVIIDRQAKKVTYTGLYYYLAHFSKFVRPGAVRIEARGAFQGVRCVAFKTAEGGFVAELLNSRTADAAVELDAKGRALPLHLPALSITTCLWKP